MKIPSTAITSRTCSIVEFPDEYAINGLLYKKDTMENTGQTCIVPQYSNQSEIIIDRYAVPSGAWIFGRGVVDQGWFYDSNDSSILWMIHNNIVNDSYYSYNNQIDIARYELINGQWTFTKSYLWASSSTSLSRYVVNVVYQDTTWIYFTVACWSGNITSGYDLRLNKHTMEGQYTARNHSGYWSGGGTVFSTANNNLWTIKTDSYASYRLLLTQIGLNPNERIINAWASADAFENAQIPADIVNVPKLGTYQSITQDVCVAYEADSFYYMSHETRNVNGFQKIFPKIWLITFNPDTQKLKTEIIHKEVIGPQEFVDNYEIACFNDTSNTGPGEYWTYKTNRLDTFEDDGKKYIVLTTHRRGDVRAINFAVGPQYWKIVVFEDIGDDKFEIKSITYTENQITQIVSNRSNSKYLMSTYAGVYLYVWERSSQSFIKAKTWEGDPHSFGFDRDERVIIKYMDDSIEIDNTSIAQSVTTKITGIPAVSEFKAPEEGLLTIDWTNTNKVCLPSNLKVYLKGCLFADGTKVKEFNISNGNNIEMPVFVSGPTMYKAVVTI